MTQLLAQLAEAGLVSCIVPAFNAERFILEALGSIVAQTYRPLEIILADDGSTDQTAALVAAYPHPITYLHQPNAGPGAARNLGLGVARGEFIAFLDPDDRWHPEKLARQTARLAAMPELGLSLSHVQNFWDDEISGEAESFRDHRRAQPVPGYTATAMLVRRSVFQSIGEFNIYRWSTDNVEWILRARDQGVTIEMLPDVLLFRRLHRANISRVHSAEFRREWLRFVKDRLDQRRAG